MRHGCFTHHDETQNRGSLRNRKPPSAWAWLLYARMTSGSLSWLAAILVPSTTQAWRAVLNLLLIRPDLDVHLPVNRRQRGGGRRPARAGVVGRVDEVVGRSWVIGPRFRKSVPRGLSGLRRLKAVGLSVKEVLLNRLVFALTSVFDVGLGSRQRG